MGGVFTVGALNKPVAEMLPTLACQITAVQVVPVSEALSCKIPPEVMSPVEGVTWTRTLAVWLPVLVLDPWNAAGAQEIVRSNAGRRASDVIARRRASIFAKGEIIEWVTPSRDSTRTLSRSNPGK